MPRPPLTIEEILAWAESHRARTGKWPTIQSGPVYEALGESWLNINAAMCIGVRGFKPRQTTLARLLAENRGKRNPSALPPLTNEQILNWAQAHHERTGQWPTPESGSIPGTEETWQTVEMALYRGRRGLAKSSLAKLLAKERGRKLHEPLPSITVKQIREWARAYKQTHGQWPNKQSGEIEFAPAESWLAVLIAMQQVKCFGIEFQA